jgi:thioredoxin-like negative regulator of GroEL
MPTLAEAKQAADQGAIQQARLMYEDILQDDPRSEDAWFGLADVLTDAEDKRVCYKNILKINKKSREAKEGLRSLEPQADPLRAAFDIVGDEPEESPTENEEEPEEPDDDATDVEKPKIKKSKKKRATSAKTGSEDDPPTPILVAFGLALSVVVFAIGSGIVYVMLSSLNG